MEKVNLQHDSDYDCTILRATSGSQIASYAREYYEAYFVLEGSAEYWIENQHYKTRPGDAYLVPAGTMLGGVAKQRGCPYVRARLWVSGHLMRQMLDHDEAALFAFELAEKSGHFLLRPTDKQRARLQYMFELVSQECTGQELNKNLACRACIAGLMVELNRSVRENGADLLAGEDNRLSPVLEYIHSHCTEALTVEKLADEFGYSPSHLAHSFKKQMGTSLYHYVLLRRLQIGRRAMLNDMPVREAYQMCGFSDYAGFYRAFTKEFGVSPQQYKKKN